MTKKLGITASKQKDFSEWYTQVIQRAELIEYSKVSGCVVFRPRSYAMWEKIKAYLDGRFKEVGVENAYFPLFIPESLLTKEQEHVEGFTPEVAWVTHSGSSKLPERLAVRPTSETIMYDSYSKWIKSHRDLPLLINQWCNVVRWEFKNPVPFLRTREFLWQEGHTVHATKEESAEFAVKMLDRYADAYEKMLAVPMIKGRKSDKEKFAGADYTLSIETFLPNGKAIQGATSHCLGQNFAKVFDITFIDKNEKKQYAWQNSWGFTTRSIGVMIMMHSDDKGLVIPPRIAPVDAVIVPIIFDDTKEKVLLKAKQIEQSLKGFKIIFDDRDEYTPGWKYNNWEMKGIPVRIELGPKDLAKDQVVMVRRDTGKKEFVKTKDIMQKLDQMLEQMQEDLLKKAKKMMNESIVEAENFDQVMEAIKNKKLVLMPWCKETECEDWIKDKTGGAKTINIPFDSTAKGKCAHCGKEAKVMVYVAKSY